MRQHLARFLCGLQILRHHPDAPIVESALRIRRRSKRQLRHRLHHFHTRRVSHPLQRLPHHTANPARRLGFAATLPFTLPLNVKVTFLARKPNIRIALPEQAEVVCGGFHLRGIEDNKDGIGRVQAIAHVADDCAVLACFQRILGDGISGTPKAGILDFVAAEIVRARVLLCLLCRIEEAAAFRRDARAVFQHNHCPLAAMVSRPARTFKIILHHIADIQKHGIDARMFRIAQACIFYRVQVFCGVGCRHPARR